MPVQLFVQAKTTTFRESYAQNADKIVIFMAQKLKLL